MAEQSPARSASRCWACDQPGPTPFTLRGAAVCSPECVVGAGEAIAPGAEIDERPARSGEKCVCGAPASTAFVADGGDVPYCGVYGGVRP